ncbi:hypothetical protein OSCT_0313 [Oscillochloris trichoides DG-6]|uniref:Uncharacterized protein n=1 Tax=Oscillochloris trichoides DG-6 TaxID=765420 RepID=E1IAG2_9CHLR|nr:hypothetical protein OSCT_0313 [Oscillochloris trichoides DG-6]
MGLSELGNDVFVGGTVGGVSIRRADLGLSELFIRLRRGRQSATFQSAGRIWGFRNDTFHASIKRHALSFNPPGGFGAFGTLALQCPASRPVGFQSAGRIWGFRNCKCEVTHDPYRYSFNPPGGFGAFGTGRQPVRHGWA